MRIPKPHLFLILSLLVAALIALAGDRFDSYFVEVAMGAGINIILAVSLNLVNGYTGQFSLGHAGFMGVGAYVASFLSLTYAARVGEGSFSQGLFFFAILVAGGLVAAVAGLVVGIPSLRLKGDYLALVTLGFGEIIRVIIQNVDALGGALGLVGMNRSTNLFWTFGFAALTIFVVYCLVHSTYGRGFLATRDDEIASESIGLNTTKYKIVAFVVGAFFAGIAGGLFAHLKQAIEPTGFNFNRSIEIVVMVILGGMGNMVGVIFATILLTLLPEFLRPVAEYRMILYSFLLIVLMLARPQGLLNFSLRKAKSTKAPV